MSGAFTAISGVLQSSGVPVDMLLTFESGTVGNVWTTSSIVSSMVGTAWTAALSVSPLQHTKVGNFNRTIEAPTSLGNGSGTQGILFDLTLAVSIGATPIYEFIQLLPPSTFSKLTVSGRSQFNVTASGDLSNDPIDIEGGSYSTMQLAIGTGVISPGTQGILRIESQVSGATIKFGQIPVNLAQWYRWHLRFNGPAGTAELIVFNDDTNAFVGSSFTGPCDITGPVSFLKIQDYLGEWSGGNYMHDNIAFAWTIPAFPLEPFTLPPVTNVQVSQTSANTVTLTWDTPSHGTFLVERELSGVWSALNSAYFVGPPLDQTYIDSTTTNGQTYTYRVTSQLSDLSSSVVTSSSITINNSTAPVASDNFDSYIDSDFLGEADANWTQINGFVQIFNPTSIDGSVYGGGSQDFAASTATFTNNQRSEATTRLIGTSFSFLSVGVRGQAGDSRYWVQVDGSSYFLVVRIAGVQSVISTGSLSLSSGDGIAIEASGLLTSTRLKVQTRSGPSGPWSNFLIGVDPGAGNYFNGGSAGVGGDGGASTTTLLDDWAGYNV